MEEERRDSERRRTLKAGRIVFGGLSQVFNCTVKNTSDGGALLSVPSTVGVPGAFLLYIDNESTRRPVEVVWRTEDKLGIRYIGPAESTLRRSF
ncbi:PilZ domain-containing protein [Roseibium suaedae]|uniref:PilZ domain-containing protein n=1 Tax=Roseibium suaedae TaxID=735517 RepID=A0A1M7LHU4_9HYPH|nr:PilZ domain-containing protein [Roseibium suaedae]SHM77685.1 PilZ domain-containing protein [Roseibium suaedae]